MAKPSRRAGRLELPHPPEPLDARASQRLRRRPEREGTPHRRVPLVPRRRGSPTSPTSWRFYAPTVNSYKRYDDGSWAPTRIAWSYDNRTAGFRVVGHGQSLRIECRIPGADCNPYLALAARRSPAGLDGIEQQIEPPAVLRAATCTRPPTCPGSRHPPGGDGAVRRQRLRRPAFGPDVVEHYAHFFRTEEAALRRRGHRLGAAALLREDLS